MRLPIALLTLAVCAAAAACSPVDRPTASFAGPDGEIARRPDGPDVPPSSPIVWRVDPDCLADPGKSPAPAMTSETDWVEARRLVRKRCKQNAHDFVAIGISGGGTKAAIFGAESMFFLEALGALRRAALVSSVSGGSFAASYYALSCEPNDDACRRPIHNGLTRPDWTYEKSMKVMARGFEPMLWRAVKNFLIPLVGTPVRVSSFAHYIDRTYMGGEGSGEGQFLFSDLNPRRPVLALNSTLLSGARPLAEATRGLHYLRRRNADEMLHFAFTDYYFNHIGSDLGQIPLSYGVASSAAFPALIGYGQLRNFRYCVASKDQAAYDECLGRDDTKLTLTDGGANDNQGLIELLAAMGELALHERRSDLATSNCVDRKELLCNQYFAPGDRALLFVLNSSITESTGTDGQGDIGFHPLGFILGTVGRVSAAVDAYSAVGYNLRRRLYMADRDEVDALLKSTNVRITPVEIGLTTLDRYADQGADVSRRREAKVLSEKPCAAPRAGDPEYVGRELDCETRIQKKVWDHLRKKGVREQLALGRVHPQCLFEESKAMESGLTSLAQIDEVHLPCLREAARWATALRAEELCQREAAPSPVDRPFADGDTIACQGGHLAPLADHWRNDFAKPPHCDMQVQVRSNSSTENATIALALAEAESFVRERYDLTQNRAERRSLAREGKLDVATLCDMNDVNYVSAD